MTNSLQWLDVFTFDKNHIYITFLNSLTSCILSKNFQPQNNLWLYADKALLDVLTTADRLQVSSVNQRSNTFNSSLVAHINVRLRHQLEVKDIYTTHNGTIIFSEILQREMRSSGNTLKWTNMERRWKTAQVNLCLQLQRKKRTVQLVTSL